ncbi:Catsper1, partial [Symbiodinium sp. CCMP2456]
AILLGVEIDYASTLPEADIPAWLGLLNAVIVCVFVLEIILKLIAYGCRGFWRGPQAWWNIFDFFIVAVSALETVLDLWARSLVAAIWGSDAFSVVRTMRLARALRGMRFLRVFRYFSALRVLVLSIVSTINSLLWTIVLLFIIFYSFGVILTQLVTDYCRFLAVEASNNMNAVPECPAELDKYWSSIGQSMLTLFYAITNGVAWSDAVRPLEDVSLLAVAFVIFYIIISVFTLLNVVTGVFVNTAIERASADKDIAALKAFQKRKEQIQVLRHAFEAMDHWQTNNLKIKDIEEAMGLESVGA